MKVKLMTLIAIAASMQSYSVEASTKELRHSYVSVSYQYNVNCECRCRPSFELNATQGIYFEGLAGFNQVITVKPSSYNAAIFNIRGGYPYAWVKFSINNDRLYPLDPRKNDKVSLRDYKFGGNSTYDGYAMLDRHGNLDNVRLGASVKIKSKNKSNVYYGTPKLKVDYLW